MRFSPSGEGFQEAEWPARPTDASSSEQPESRHWHFVGHQQYPLQAGWIAIGLRALAEAEQRGDAAHLFAFPAATGRFGMEPAMVRALRYWLRATGVMAEYPGPGVRPIPALTPLGRLLLETDPSLERGGSIWLLHAHLVRNPSWAPTFTWFFQHFLHVLPWTFTAQECIQAGVAWATREAPAQEIRPAAVRSDVRCVLQLYLPHPLRSLEAGAVSPFQRLGLLGEVFTPLARNGRTSPRYGWASSREMVPALIVLAVLLEQGGRQVSLQHLLAPMQIGRTFGLSRHDLLDVLASLRRFAPTWGPQVERFGRQEWVRVPEVSVAHVLHAYYRSSESC